MDTLSLALEPKAVVRALLVPDDAAQPMRTVLVQRSLNGLQCALSACNVQMISGLGWTAWLDENGMARRLDVNHRATVLARNLGWGGVLFPPGALLGPVAFFGDPDDEGYHSEVPPLVLEAANFTAGDEDNHPHPDE